MNKKVIYVAVAAVAAVMAVAGFAKPKTKAGTTNSVGGKRIVVVSREAGSGTRGAFIELFGVEKKNSEGKKVDMTRDDAGVTNSTAVMLNLVGQNKAAIGYASVGSLLSAKNDKVRALKIEGFEATVKNIEEGKYKIKRPFNIVTKEGITSEAEDFVAFILSKEGQAVVEKEGYIKVVKDADAKSYTAASLGKGKVTITGSSSVYPLMEKLCEEYAKLQKQSNIDLSMADSSVGVQSAQSGVCDIGMCSRDLKESEQGVKATSIAMDGIAVIVNKDNGVQDLSVQDVQDIYVGKKEKW